MKNLTLHNGVEMPQLGYGVFQVDPNECERCVTDALSVGYRHIDTAQVYANEEGVGAAVAKSGIARNELFITSKIWISNFGEKKAAESIDVSLRKLQTDYIDLMLIHQPFGDYYGAYRALEAALKAGKVRAIGVSNFYPGRLVDMCKFAEVKPMVNQIETHPYYQRAEDLVWMKKYGVVHESWGPFAEGRNNLFTDPVLTDIAAKHDRSVAQVVLRYLMDLDIVVIPKSVRKERMAENFDVFSFSLEAEDKARIKALEGGKPLFFDHRTPEASERFAGMA